MDATAKPRPYFLPEDLNFDELPASLRRAIEALIQPAYDELVLEAESALERAAGGSFVFLCVLELLDQFEIGRQIVGRESVDATARHEMLTKALRVIKEKERWSRFLLKLRSLPLRHPTSNVNSLSA